MAISFTCFPLNLRPGSFKVVWLLISMTLVSLAKGQDLDQDNDGIPDTYEKGLGDLTFGSAFNIQGEDNSAVAINDEEVQLTQDQRSLRGSAMSYGMIDLMDDFSFTIEAYFGINRDQDLFSSSGADGIAVVFHNDPSGSFAIGVDGEGIGAQGIRNGIVLEIDTYGNGDTGANDPMRGAGDNHTDIWDSDDSDRVSLIGGYRTFREGEASPLEDGTYHEVIFNWVASTGTLSFTVDGIASGELSLGSAETFVNTYFAGSSAVHFGFTASTGAARNEHRVRIIDMASLPVVMDTDNDGIYDHLDLDSDNDGIYDAEEAGHGADHVDGIVSGGDENGDGIPDAVQNGTAIGNIDYTVSDIDGDGIYNHQDPDADGDGCLDVAEMGFSDDDQNGELGSGVPTVDGNGVVVGVSGYTVPNVAFRNPNQNGCLLATDLGDDGDGDDVYVIFYEDESPLDLMVNPQILNMNEGTGILTIEISGVLDDDQEKLFIGDMEVPLVSNNEVIQVEMTGVSLEVNWQGQLLIFSGPGSAALPQATMESILDQLAYHHADTLLPGTGERTLSITIDNGINQSASNWVTISVVPVNDQPLADADTVTINQLNAIEIDILNGDVDWDGVIDPGTVAIVTDPDQGALSVNPTGTVTYAPTSSATDNDSFYYQVQDDEGGVSNEARVVILFALEATVENNAPVAIDDVAETFSDQPLQVLAADGLLANDQDEDGDELQIIGLTILGEAYTVGTIIQLAEGVLLAGTDGSYSFTPAAGFEGEVPPISYEVSDGNLSDTASLQITVVNLPANQAPVARDTLLVVQDLAGITFEFSVLVTEPDNDTVTFEVLDISADQVPGSLSWTASGELVFTPVPGFVGSFTLTYQVCDDANPASCDEAVVTIQVDEMDTDGDGLLDHEEDTNGDLDLTNDDCDDDGIPNYLDGDSCVVSLIIGDVVTNNGDQRNDFFKVEGIEQYRNNQVIIFNRWGNQVWQVKGYDNTLDDRRFSGIGNSGALPDGTYYYVIHKGDNSLPIKGFLTLKNQ